jgi:hypothetical protein
LDDILTNNSIDGIQKKNLISIIDNIDKPQENIKKDLDIINKALQD